MNKIILERKGFYMTVTKQAIEMRAHLINQSIEHWLDEALVVHLHVHAESMLID